MYELHREIGRGCIFLSPLSPFRIKFQNFFPTFSRALIVEPSPIISKLIALMEAIQSIEMNSRLTEFSRIQITRFTEFPRVLSFARARNIEHAGKCRCRVFAFPFTGGGQGAPLSFACLPELSFLLIAIIDGDEFFSFVLLKEK